MLNRELEELDIQPGSKQDISKTSGHRGNNFHILKQANQVILKQQMAVMEEQRLNILFQMLGIALHELNQPLTSLLGNIELMVLNKDNPEKLAENIERVDEAGKRFSGIIRKIQNIRQGGTSIQDHLFCPMKTKAHQYFLMFVSDKQVVEKIESVINKIDAVSLIYPDLINPAPGDYSQVDLVIMDEKYMVESEVNTIKQLKSRYHAIPIMAVLSDHSQDRAFQMIEDGIDDYTTLKEFNQETVHRMLNHLKEKAKISYQLKASLNDLAGMSPQDKQTGLFQRKFFRDALEREVTKAKRKGICCVIGKIDINDCLCKIQSQGLDNTALVVKNISEIIQQTVGQSQLVCRYANESFAFILSRTSGKQAQRRCENLQTALEHYFVDEFSWEKRPCLFIGLTQFCPENIYPANELMGRMDKAVSQARDIGQSPLWF